MQDSLAVGTVARPWPRIAADGSERAWPAGECLYVCRRVRLSCLGIDSGAQVVCALPPCAHAGCPPCPAVLVDGAREDVVTFTIFHNTHGKPRWVLASCMRLGCLNPPAARCLLPAVCCLPCNLTALNPAPSHITSSPSARCCRYLQRVLELFRRHVLAPGDVLAFRQLGPGRVGVVVHKAGTPVRTHIVLSRRKGTARGQPGRSEYGSS